MNENPRQKKKYQLFAEVLDTFIILYIFQTIIFILTMLKQREFILYISS